MKLTHYHDHAMTCKQCKKATDAFDIFAFLNGDERQVDTIFKNSCEAGRDMFVGFLLSLSDKDADESLL